jgi:molybdopterin/thiamine biosynthesis adenylyltransferase
MNDNELERYSRQLLVPGFELEGQEVLSSASVLIVGCGGLGALAAQYLAAAGIGHLALVDADRIELSNLPRQIAYTEDDVGRFKAEVLA